MLAVQMAATHMSLIRAGSWLAKANDLQRLEAYSRAYNKLARTYAAQMEALANTGTEGSRRSAWSTSMCTRADRPSWAISTRGRGAEDER